MERMVRWLTVLGLGISGGVLLIQKNWELAITALILPLLIALIPIIFQNKTNKDHTHPSGVSSWFKGRDFHKEYLSQLRYQNRDFDIKGLSTQTKYTLELEQVFVDLKLQPQAAHKATADPLQNIPLRYRKDSYPIWRFFTLLGDEKAHNPKIVIVGPPGSGKTTLLKHMTLLLATTTPRDEESKAKIKKIPVIIFLRDYVNSIVDNPAILLPEIIDHNVKKLDLAPTPNWFSNKLKKGECLVLLDGLDEVAEPALRRKMVAWMEHQIHVYPNNAFIVTSRPHGYRENPISGVTVLEVMPFNRAQIDSFVQRWYLANEVKSHAGDDPGVRMTAKSGADDLLRRLEKNATLMELAVNPLLLTMIATVHRYRSALPGRRVELYKEICEVFLGKRQESKGLSIDMVPAQKQTVLQTLAYEMMDGQIREVRKPDAMEIIRQPLAMVAPTLDPDVFLKSIEQQTGLLLERELGIYSFAHKTFQEYLASMYILEKNLESELYARIDDDWWHEVIKLYSAQADATQLITVCLDRDPPSSAALSLAIQCLEEAQQVKPELRDIAERILMENAEDEDAEIRTIIGQALLSNRLKHLSALSPSVSIDTKLVTNAEYQIFVDDMLLRGGGDFYLVQWDSKTFPRGIAHSPAVGLTPDDAVAFCEWLTTLHAGSGEWYFRLPVKEEIQPRHYSEVPGFWMLPAHTPDTRKTPEHVEFWKNPDFTWRPTPLPFIQGVLQEDLKTIVSSLRNTSRNIPELNDDFYTALAASLRKLVSAAKSDAMLVEAAKTIYHAIHKIDTSRPVDFGFEAVNLEEYDQSLSDSIERISNHDFESAIINAMKCFSNLIRTNIRSLYRIQILYLAVAFQFFVNWVESNKSRFMKSGTKGLHDKIDYLVDQYVDELIVFGRKKNVTHALEGLLIVKEVRKEE